MYTIVPVPICLYGCWGSQLEQDHTSFPKAAIFYQRIFLKLFWDLFLYQMDCECRDYAYGGLKPLHF